MYNIYYDIKSPNVKATQAYKLYNKGKKPVEVKEMRRYGCLVKRSKVVLLNVSTLVEYSQVSSMLF